MIEIKNVSKKFRLQGHRSDFELKNILEYFARKIKKRKENPFFWALKDVSFTLEKGQRLGIIGDNGSGKTTLLKIIAGISKQTSGTVKIDQHPMLLETSFGLKNTLTARENLYTRACILGMSDEYIDSIIDEVVEFAELGKHMDQPIKYFSSGMSGRLGFSLARYINHDLILMDETLSRGDVHFADKTSDIFSKWAEEGKTFVMVSHSLQSIKKVCTHCLYLKKGRIEAYGSPEEVIAEYTKDIEKIKEVEDIPEFDK